MINILMGIGGIIGIVIGAVVLILIIALVSWGVKAYNNLVKGRNKVKNQWAQIDVQVKRRFDLIPNLVETVKGYAKHESEILTQFADARKMYASAKDNNSASEMAKADANLSKALSIFVNAVTEQYPQLKADTQFTSLQNHISDVEEQLQAARRLYNANVSAYNQAIIVFPGSLVANSMHLTKREFFEAEETKKADVKMEF